MELKQVIVVRSDLDMGKGKIAAQCAHASLEAFEKTAVKHADWVEEWRSQGQAKVVLRISGRKELLQLFEESKRELPVALIKDAGRTQIRAGEPTCIGIGPVPKSKADRCTGKLKLL